MVEIVEFCKNYKQEMFDIQDSVMPINDKMSKELFFDEFNQKNRHYFVALFNKKIVGYIGLYSYDNDENIVSIAVKEQFQDMSIGTKLIERAKDFARKNKKISLSLEVDEKNKKAIEFYKANGFVVTNIRKKYYKDSDALIMFCYI